MTFISYAQNFEDVMLWRALKDVSEGFYIDVGAHDPEAGSVTKAFYERGWHGINIEPAISPFESLKSTRPRDINLNICAGMYEGRIEFYDVRPSGLATASTEIAEKYRAEGKLFDKIITPVSRLENICRQHVTSDIHFLKIDVEGYEKEVLMGADFNAFRPWILVIESTIPYTSTENSDQWESLVLEKAYHFVYFDGLNRYYLAKEHSVLSEHFKLPPNFFDGFALGPKCFFSRVVYEKMLQESQRAAFAEVKLEQESQRADIAQATLDTVYRSLSWRLTRPLRILSSVLRIFRTRLHSVISIIFRTTKSFIAPGLAKLIKFANSRPRIKSFLTALLRFSPRLEELLRRFAASRGLFYTADHSITANFDISSKHKDLRQYENMGPTAFRIYTDLKNTVETCKAKRISR